jgi:glucokinase
MTRREKQYTIGIDVGGTKMGAVLFDGQKVIADYTLATPIDNLENFLVMLKALVEPLVEKARNDKVKIKGVGLGVAGVINYQEGRMLTSPNIPIIDGIKIAEELAARIELPVVMDNDTNCFLRAEMKIGAGKKYKNAYGIIIGTGIGGAWWYNSEVYKGAYGGAGEPWKMVIDFQSEIGLEEAYHKLAQNNPGKLAQEAYRGDPLADKTFKEIGNILGIAFANIVNIVDPEVIIIGGGVVESSDLFLSKAKKAMRKHIDSSESKKNVKILKSKIGQQAGAIGAAMLIA